MTRHAPWCASPAWQSSGLARAQQLSYVVDEITGLLDRLRHPKRSEFESVVSDSSGRVFPLSELGSRLLVLSPELRFERNIHLRYQPEHPKDGGLESPLLLRKGHILSAKQRRPVALIEFGPAGDDPNGVSPATLLGLMSAWIYRPTTRC